MPNNVIRQDFGSLGNDVQTQMLIAPVLSKMVSDRAYVVGEQFIVDNVLYKITQAVSAADVPLVVGTNCEMSDSITQQMKSGEWHNLDTNGKAKYKKVNGVIFVSIAGYPVTPNSTTTIGTLPTDYCPESTISGYADGEGTAYVYPSGVVTVKTTINNVYATLSYPSK